MVNGVRLALNAFSQETIKKPPKVSFHMHFNGMSLTFSIITNRWDKPEINHKIRLVNTRLRNLCLNPITYARGGGGAFWPRSSDF